jgi:hypothetical protein
VKVATNGAGDISPSQPQPKKKKLSKPVAKPQSDPDIEGKSGIGSKVPVPSNFRVQHFFSVLITFSVTGTAI